MSRVYTRSMLLKRKARLSGFAGKNMVPPRDQSIIAFTEEISPNTKQANRVAPGELNADQLFNIFTADIIKTNAAFVR